MLHVQDDDRPPPGQLLGQLVRGLPLVDRAEDDGAEPGGDGTDDDRQQPGDGRFHQATVAGAGGGTALGDAGRLLRGLMDRSLLRIGGRVGVEEPTGQQHGQRDEPTPGRAEPQR